MAFGLLAPRTAEQAHEAIAGVDRADVRARLIGFAGAVHLARGDAGNADLRAFSTPNWSVAIPNGRRSACECLPRGYDLKKCGKQHLLLSEDVAGPRLHVATPIHKRHLVSSVQAI